jgi:PAS domain S-box-containing protein
VDKFIQWIDIVRQQTQTFSDQVADTPVGKRDLIETFAELQVALEELRVAEEELREQNDLLEVARYQVEVERQRYQDLFDFAPDGYIVTNTEGIIQEANHAAVTMLNVTKKFFIGKPLINFVPEEERRAFRSQLNRLRNINRIQDWEIRLQSRYGSIFYCSLSIVTILDSSNNLVGLRWLLRDITIRKQAEEQLRSIQLENLQLQETARLKSQFLAVVSHELRTPMNAILGFSQLLLRQNSDYISSESKTMVERIRSSGKSLLRLIEDILDFSTAEAGRLELHLQEFDLEELVKLTVEELNCLAKQKNLLLNICIELKNPMVINDSDRVRQILVNLISNAIKFTDIGGICIELREVNKDRIALIITDTGIGISEPDLKHIFKEFWQINQSINRKHNGTGLGLAIVKQLVDLMKGSVTVESKVYQGSTFRVELPRQIAGC